MLNLPLCLMLYMYDFVLCSLACQMFKSSYHLYVIRQLPLWGSCCLYDLSHDVVIVSYMPNVKTVLAIYSQTALTVQKLEIIKKNIFLISEITKRACNINCFQMIHNHVILRFRHRFFVELNFVSICLLHNFQISKDIYIDHVLVQKNRLDFEYIVRTSEKYIFSMKLYVYSLKIRVDSNKGLVTKHKMEKGSRTSICLLVYFLII